ncbi:MAG: alpha/beta hydrolase [Pseudomonadota bacterium]
MANDHDMIVIDPPAQTDAVVIWLHGLGADGNDFVPIVPELNLPEKHGIKFIFPHAPVRPITINGGMEMRGWYDIANPQLRRDIDLEGIQESTARIREMIDAEIDNGIASERIILAGFSQGGAITYYLGLRYAKRLGGLIALSTYIPAVDELAAEISSHNDVPIFIGHGTHDPLVPESLGRKAEATLLGLDRSVLYRSYPMEHSVCLEEINDVAEFLKSRLNH